MKLRYPAYFRLLVIGVISMNALVAWSQPKSEQVTTDMLKSMTYDKDPEAPAVFLFDIGKSKFIENATGQFEIHFTRKLRIKIYDKDAYNLGNIHKRKRFAEKRIHNLLC
jgi:hypothetical protein